MSKSRDARLAKIGICNMRPEGMKWKCKLPKGHAGDCDYHELVRKPERRERT